MKEEYKSWIDKLTPEEKNGKCDKITLRMKEAFPELKRVRGHVYLAHCRDERAHWWMKDECGEIIDPTVSQFTDPNYIYGGVCIPLHYDEWDESMKEPEGKCMECGQISFYTAHACSRACERILETAFS